MVVWVGCSLQAQGRGARAYQRPLWARKFYSSQAWKNCRDAYAASVGGLCERCMEQGRIEAGEIVHHKTPLNASNAGDPTVSLNWDNLQLVCTKCHAEIHSGKRWRVDEYGRVII